MRLAALTLLLVAGAARADVRFYAQLTRENITVAEDIELTINIERDGNQPLESYRAPSAPDLDLLHQSTSEQMQVSIVGTQQSVRVVQQHRYVYHARAKGHFTIGPALCKINGQQLSTKPLVVHVAPTPKNALVPVTPPPLAGQPAPPPPSARPLLPPPPEGMRGDEEVFVDATCDKPRAWVGEEVVCTWRLYTASDILKYRAVTEPKHEDFWAEPLAGPGRYLSWDRQIIKGREYAVALLMKKALFPLRAGKLTVSPLEVEVTTMQSAFYANASATRRSPALALEAQALPSAGRPTGFDPSRVGQLELVTSVDKTSVKADDTVTVRLVVRGNGNIRTLRPPRLEDAEGKLDGWKVYDPTQKDDIVRSDVVHGEKTLTYLLLPQKGGTLTIPVVDMAYFDPATGKYAKTQSVAASVTVLGQPTPAAENKPTVSPENVLSQQLRPIRNRGQVRSQLGENLWRGTVGLVLLAGPPGAWLLVLLVDGVRRRLARETPRSKRRRARRAARGRLRRAEYSIRVQRPSAFFGECARVIYEHLEYRLGQKMEAYTLSEMRAQLEARGFEKELAEAVVHELETCDYARFSPAASGPGEMRAAMRRVRNLLAWIEKARLQREAA